MKTLAMVLLILAGPLAAFSEEFPGGWDKVRWGMTEAEISQLYPGVQRKTQDGRYEFNGRKYASNFMLPDVELVGSKFTAHFLMDLTGRLACVQIERDFGTSEKCQAAYAQLKEQLSKQYSPPAEEQDIAKPYIYKEGSKEATWHGTNARVDLRCLMVDVGTLKRVSIAYQKPVSTNKQ